MNPCYQDQRHAILFDIRETNDDVLNEIAFAYLVQSKFAGTIESVSRFWDVVGTHRKRFIRIDVTFPDLTQFADARGHCYRNLAGDGSIRYDYLGALDHADPHRKTAKKLFDDAKSKPVSN